MYVGATDYDWTLLTDWETEQRERGETRRERRQSVQPQRRQARDSGVMISIFPEKQRHEIVQCWAKRCFPGCVNAAGKAW